jgi:tetratricopeptide (TPR) repeat protein
MEDIAHGIQGVISARLTNLEPTALQTLEIASNIADRFAFDVLRSVSGLDEGVLLQAIAQLTDAHILQETSGRSAFDYCFTHNLIRDAVYARIPSEQRRRRHYRIAQAFAGERFGEDRAFAGEIARHFDLANARAEAVKWYGRAARYASEAYANAEALAALECALRLVDDAGERFELLKLHESLRHRLGETAGRQEDLSIMERLAGDLGEPYVFDVLTRRVELAINKGNIEEARTLTSEMELHALLDDQRSGALIAFAKARILRIEGHLAESLEYAESALPGFHDAGDAHSELEVHCLIVDLCIKLADFPRVRNHIDLASHCGLGETEQLAHTLLAASRESFATARYDEAEELARESHDAFASVGDRQGIADAAYFTANALGRLGRFREAMTCCTEAGDIYCSIGNRSRMAAVRANLGTLHSWRGNFPEARALFTAADKVFGEMKDARGQTVTTGNLGWIELMLGHNKEARTFSAHAVERAHRMESPELEGQFLANLGVSERELGEIDLSITHLEQSIELRGRALTRSELFNDLSELALSYAQRGDCDRAADLAREVVTQAHAHEHTVWLHYILWTAARAFAHCGLEREAEDARLQAREYMLRRRAEIEDDPVALAAFDDLTFHRNIDTPLSANRPASNQRRPSAERASLRVGRRR